MEWWQQLNAGMPAGQPRPGSVEALNLAMQAQQSQKPTSQGIDPRAWISEIAGTAGTIGGGLIGGPVGAGIGGASLTALGKTLEQKVKGEAINPQDLLTESALAGLFGYGPLRAAGKLTGISATKGLQALGAKTAKQLASEAAKTTAQTATQAAAAKAVGGTKKNLLTTTFNIFAAAKDGTRTLTEKQSEQLLQYGLANNLFTKNTTAKQAYVKLSKLLASQGDEIGLVIKNSVPKTPINNKLLVKDLQNAFSQVDIVDWKKTQFAKSVLNKVKSSNGDPAKIWRILQDTRVTANLAKAPDAASGGVRQLSDKAYGVLSKSLKTSVPGYKELAKDYSTGRLLDGFLASAARSSKLGKTTIGKLPLSSAAMERIATTVSAPGKATAEVAAKGPGMVQGAYNLLNPAFRQGVGISGLKEMGPRAALQIGGKAVPSATRRMIGAQIVGGQGPTGEMPAEMSTAAAGQAFGGQAPTGPGVQSPYPYENLLYDMERDPQNADKYLDYYNQISQLYAGPKLNATQQQRAIAANNALSDIPLLVDAIQSGKLGLQQAIPGAQTGVGQRVLGTGNLQAAMFNVVDNILRARTGAAMPETEVKRYMLYLMPTPYETKEVQLEKLARLTRELQGYANPTGSAGTTLEDLLMQQSGGR